MKRKLTPKCLHYIISFDEEEDLLAPFKSHKWNNSVLICQSIHYNRILGQQPKLTRTYNCRRIMNNYWYITQVFYKTNKLVKLICFLSGLLNLFMLRLSWIKFPSICQSLLVGIRSHNSYNLICIVENSNY